jgi:hypothetical protein
VIPYWLQLVACTGLTSIIIYGSIFNKPRNWVKDRSTILKAFLGCSLCVGFWSGLTVSLLCNAQPTEHIILALCGSSCSWLYDSIVGSAQAAEVHLTKHDD